MLFLTAGLISLYGTNVSIHGYFKFRNPNELAAKHHPVTLKALHWPMHR